MHHGVMNLVSLPYGYRFPSHSPFNDYEHHCVAQLMRRIQRAISAEIPDGYSREKQDFLHERLNRHIHRLSHLCDLPNQLRSLIQQCLGNHFLTLQPMVCHAAFYYELHGNLKQDDQPLWQQQFNDMIMLRAAGCIVKLHMCPVCETRATKRCSGCKLVFYCSQEHQWQHWRESHRGNCHAFQDETDDDLE